MGVLSDNIVPFFEAHTNVVYVALFCLMYLIIHSDVFNQQILSRIDGALQGNYTTTKGTLITMGFTTIAYMLILVLLSAVL